jgi:hypothetical protein
MHPEHVVLRAFETMARTKMGVSVRTELVNELDYSLMNAQISEQAAPGLSNQSSQPISRPTLITLNRYADSLFGDRRRLSNDYRIICIKCTVL